MLQFVREENSPQRSEVEGLSECSVSVHKKLNVDYCFSVVTLDPVSDVRLIWPVPVSRIFCVCGVFCLFL